MHRMGALHGTSWLKDCTMYWHHAYYAKAIKSQVQWCSWPNHSMFHCIHVHWAGHTVQGTGGQKKSDDPIDQYPSACRHITADSDVSTCYWARYSAGTMLMITVLAPNAYLADTEHPPGQQADLCLPVTFSLHHAKLPARSNKQN